MRHHSHALIEAMASAEQIQRMHWTRVTVTRPDGAERVDMFEGEPFDVLQGEGAMEALVIARESGCRIRIEELVGVLA